MNPKYYLDVRSGELVNDDGEWVEVIANRQGGFAPGGTIELANGRNIVYRYSFGIVNVRRAEFVRPAGL